MALLKNILTPKNYAASHNFIGAPSFRHKNPALGFFGHYNKYAAEYPSIRAISTEYMQVRPFGIDSNGKPVQNNPIINALYHPNQTDSSISFFEKTAVSTLAHCKTYILVWRREGTESKPGGDITARNIAGFTFLEYPAVERRDGRTYYRIGAQEFNDKEVMTLPGGVDPNNLYSGYSPSEAARAWATLDDYIADYQSGFFENGAIPSGMFKIIAPTIKEYEDIVDRLQERHRGAGNNNNVTYSHQPVDPTSGKPAEAQIQWVPFSQSNKDIDFKNLFEQVNNRIDTAYGVPAIVKGIDDAATYANAQVAEAGFSKRAVKPLLLRNYVQITHELNRITGGIGIAITFDYEIPTIADEEKVKAESKNIEGGIIRDMVGAGYTLDSIVDSFGLSTSYKKLKTGQTPSTKIDNDKPDVDEGEEVDKSPDPSKIDGVTPINKKQKKKTYKKPKDELTKSDVDQYEEQLAVIIRRYMQMDIDSAIENLESTNNQSEEDEEFTDEMMTVIVAILLAAGTIQYEEGISILVAADISVDNLTAYAVSESQQKAYRDYLVNVAESYRNDTAQSIRNVLDRANIEGLTKNETEKALQEIMDTDEWRVKRLAVSEINRSQDMGSIYSMRQIQDESEAIFERSLLHTGSDSPCEFCRVYINNWMPLDENMIDKDEIITGKDGGILVYTWDNNEGHDVHPNGHCVPQFRVKQ